MYLIYSSTFLLILASGISPATTAAAALSWGVVLSSAMPLYLGTAESSTSQSGWLLLLLSAIIVSFLLLGAPLTGASMHAHVFVRTNLSLLPVLAGFFQANTLIGLFCFFEASAVLIFVLVLGWGYQPERLGAAQALMVYTAGSALPLLVSLFTWAVTWRLGRLPETSLCGSSNSSSSLLGSALVAAFLVKFPMYALHSWLPKAHVEASAGGSMLLAAVLLKMGGFGLIVFVRWVPTSVGHALSAWALWGGALVSVICLRQSDFKVLIAYSSVAHMSAAIACLVTKTALGLKAAVLIMLAHGISSSLLFFMAGEFYSMSLSRQVPLNAGLLSRTPLLATVWFLAALANMGTPPVANFWGELLAVVALVNVWGLTSLPMSLMLFTAAAYSMLLYGGVQNNVSLGQKRNALNLTAASYIMFVHTFLLFGITPALALTV